MHPLDRIERAIKILTIPATYLIGTVMNALIPVMNCFPKIPVRIFTGALILLILQQIRNMIRRKKQRREILDLFQAEERIAAVLLPKTIDEMEELGVKNPLDFCYVMMLASHYSRKNSLGISKTIYLIAPITYQHRAALCRQMFDREPARPDLKDWIVSVISEVYVRNGKVMPDLDLAQIRENVSPEVLSSTSCDDAWENELERHIRMYCRILSKDNCNK